MTNSTTVEAWGLHVHRTHQHRRNHILKDLNFALAEGSITGLLGPSGCGKTTLMRVLVGTQYYTGRVSLFGYPPQAPQLRGRIGYVTQAPTIYEDLTVEENLAYFSALCGTRIEMQILESLFLTDKSKTLCSQLSGGQRSRVSLACALVGKPRFLVLDEPTVGLDPVTREGLWQEFRRLRDEENTTIIVSSHVLDEAGRCDDLLFMREGRFIWSGEPEELLTHTNTSTFDEAFLHIVSLGGAQR